MDWALLIAAVAVGLCGAALILRWRGGRQGEWSWRDGGEDGEP